MGVRTVSKVLRSFYRPHKRVTFDNLSDDPVTGELVYLPSMTKQEFKFECDVNNVVKSFKPHHMQAMLAANLASGAYTDLPDAYDYQDALHLVQDAEKRFMTMPAKVRDRFGQDPSQFLAFINNPGNQAEAISLGLASSPAPAAEPMAVKIVSTEQSGGAGGTPPAGGAKAP